MNLHEISSAGIYWGGGKIMKEIRLDLPYPETEGIGKDEKSATIVSPAYAGREGEITAILQYVFQTHYFEREGDRETADILAGIARTEMHHLDILGGLLLELGVSPVYVSPLPRGMRFYAADKVSTAVTPCKMLLDDVAGELNAIAEYDYILANLTNERVSAVIKRIRLDEEFHVKVLRGLLERYGCSGRQE